MSEDLEITWSRSNSVGEPAASGRCRSSVTPSNLAYASSSRLDSPPPRARSFPSSLFSRLLSTNIIFLCKFIYKCIVSPEMTTVMKMNLNRRVVLKKDVKEYLRQRTAKRQDLRRVISASSSSSFGSFVSSFRSGRASKTAPGALYAESPRKQESNVCLEGSLKAPTKRPLVKFGRQESKLTMAPSRRVDAAGRVTMTSKRAGLGGREEGEQIHDANVP